MGMLNELKENMGDLLFPRRCPLCGAVINRNERICSKCSKDVEFIRRPICRICGRPLYSCSCRRGDFAFVRNVSPLVYTKAAKRGIHRMKFNNAPSSCTYFGKLMANVVLSEYIDIGIDFDCVIGVPMYSEDYRHRGYNQATLLAKTVAEEIEVPHYVNALAAAVVSLAGIALGVFVGEHAAHSRHHSGGNKVLGSDEFKVSSLSGQFVAHGGGHVAVVGFQEFDGIKHICVHRFYFLSG